MRPEGVGGKARLRDPDRISDDPVGALAVVASPDPLGAQGEKDACSIKMPNAVRCTEPTSRPGVQQSDTSDAPPTPTKSAAARP
ncbi:hypothetical protein HMPREF0185_01529 [Brevundimonas diminuta 470-4]|nr:hypothetical protein HMPREF0185_01529 [Brevundimonas diminuta 470-4]